MNKKSSIWQSEISLSPEGLFARLPAETVQWAAVICIGAFMISPFIVGILCLVHHSFDYTVYIYPTVVHRLIWPVAALAGAAALFIAGGQALRRGERLFPWLCKNPVYFLFGALVLWMLISTTVNGWSLVIVFGTGLRFETIFMQLGYVLILFPAAALLEDWQKRLWLVRLHEAVSLFLAPVSLYLWKTQLTSTLFIWSPSLTGIFSNTNYYGYYLAVSIPLAAALFVSENSWGWKLFSAMVMAGNTVVLSLNNTMGAWLACTAAFVFLLIAHGVLERRINRQALQMLVLFAVCLFLPAHLQGTFRRI